MKSLIQTEKCSIVYGTFQGKENQELFRCPRALDNVDLMKTDVFLALKQMMYMMICIIFPVIWAITDSILVEAGVADGCMRIKA